MERVVGQHDGLHAGAAHLVDGGARHGERQARAKRGLPRGRLTLPRRQHAAHQNLAYVLGLQAGARHGRGDGTTAELRRGERGERTLEAANGRAGHSHDDDWVFRRLFHGVLSPSCLHPVDGARHVPAVNSQLSR